MIKWVSIDIIQKAYFQNVAVDLQGNAKVAYRRIRKGLFLSQADVK